VAEMDSGLEQLAHGYDGQTDPPRFEVVLPVDSGGTGHTRHRHPDTATGLGYKNRCILADPLGTL
jgi:hypothetical protein